MIEYSAALLVVGFCLGYGACKVSWKVKARNAWRDLFSSMLDDVRTGVPGYRLEDYEGGASLVTPHSGSYKISPGTVRLWQACAAFRERHLVEQASKYLED